MPGCGATVLAFLVVGCYPDRVGGPITAPPSPLRSANDPPPPQQQYTFDIPVPPTNLGGAGVTVTPNIVIDPYQPYMVTVSGRVNVASNPAAAVCAGPAPYGDEGSYGPGGTGGGWGSLRVAATGVPLEEGGPGGASVAQAAAVRLRSSID